MPRIYEIPKGCPPELRSLIEKMGTKIKTFNAMGVSKDTFTRVVNGGEKMPPEWAEKIARVKKGENLGTSKSDDEGPTFAPWDGTTRVFTLPKRGSSKGRTFKKAPSMAVDLVEQHEGNVSKAARAMGTTSNTLMTMLENKVEFNEKRQRMVFEGLHGVPARGMDQDDGPDQFLRGMAIVVVNSKNYDRVREVAELLGGGGHVLFRMQTPAGWLVIYAMKAHDARKFKRIAARDCAKIVCP